MATTAPKRSRQTDLAAENARLRARVVELEAEERERVALLAEQARRLQEALAQQTATSEVLRVLADSPTDVSTVLHTIAESAVRLCGAEDAQVFRRVGDARELAAHSGLLPSSPLGSRVPLDAWAPSTRPMLERRTLHVPDVLDYIVATNLDEQQKARRIASLLRNGLHAMVSAPMLRQGEAVGSILLRRNRPGPFTEQQIRLLETFADQAAIAIENTRLFSELQESNATLEEALEQQTAMAEVLRVIAASPTNLQPVLNTIVDHTARLTGCDAVVLHLVRDDRLDIASVLDRAIGHRAVDVAEAAQWNAARGLDTTANLSLPLDRGNVGARCVLDRVPIHIPDLSQWAVTTPPDRLSKDILLAKGYTGMAAVPLLRGDRAVGSLFVATVAGLPFTDRQLALLHTFADQAVIAIENTRLFGELRERDERRRQELERAAAIQQRLLPARVERWPGVLELAVRFRPAVETSGDFFDVLRLAPPAEGALPPLQIAVGDVAGKGMSAALVTALARSALHASASMPTAAVTPSGTLRVAGQRLHRDVGSAHFVACALAVVEPPGLLSAGPLLKLANAAQVPVLLCRGGGATELEPPGDRLPLGARPDGGYEDVKVALRPGDVVVFSSDGLVEAPCLPTVDAPEHLPPAEQSGELFGFERLQQSAAHWAQRAESAEAVAEGIWSDLAVWCGEQSHHDDMTLLVLRVPNGGR